MQIKATGPLLSGRKFLGLDSVPVHHWPTGVVTATGPRSGCES